jgi:hypothetical protein
MINKDDMLLCLHIEIGTSEFDSTTSKVVIAGNN